MKEWLLKIQALKESIDALRPLDATTLGRIEQKFRLDWNYHSNAIEGNSLNFGETKSFLLHGITAAGKPLKDHLDLRGHNNAILALQDIIKEERPITENFIRELHKVILVEDSYNSAITPEGLPIKKKVKVGAYKSSNNHVETATGEIFYFATVEQTPAKMHDLIQWLREHKEQENPVVLAARFHYKFIRIHPFDDGNGRLARILMNFILMRAGFPPIVIKTKEKEAYFRALRQADGDNVEAFEQYVAEQLVASLELYLKGAKGESIEEVDDVEKAFELFRLELEGKEESILLSEDNFKQIIKRDIWPTLEVFFNKISRIESLYKRAVFRITSIQEDSSNSVEELIPNLQKILNELSFEDFKRDFRVKGYFDALFKKIYAQSITNYSFEMRVYTNNYDWGIEVLGKKSDTFRYGQAQEEEAKLLANMVLEDCMKWLKGAMK